MKVFLLIGFLICHYFVQSQIKFNVNVSKNHMQKVERAKDAGTKLKNYQKYYKKDSIEAAKAYWKSYAKNNKDSLKRLGEWKKVRANKEAFLKGRWKLTEVLQDSIDMQEFPTPKDSLDWAMQELAKSGDFGTLQEMYQRYGQYDSAYIEKFHRDSLNVTPDKLAERFEMKKRIASYMPKEMVEKNEFDFQQQMDFKSINEFGEVNSVDKSGVSNLLKKVTPEQLTKSIASMKLAKESKAGPFTSDFTKEKKIKEVNKKTLKGTPIKNRLFLNGNVNVPSTDPVVMDINLQLGYQWTDDLSSGIGFAYREQIGTGDSLSITGDSYGVSMFMKYDVLRNFFVYTEVQSMINQPLFRESDNKSRRQNAYMMGVGRELRIGKKATIQTVILYDFNHKSNTINSRPVIVRVGYKIRF